MGRIGKIYAFTVTMMNTARELLGDYLKARNRKEEEGMYTASNLRKGLKVVIEDDLTL